MKRYIYTIAVALATLGTATVITSCGENDYDIMKPVLSPISAESIQGKLVGDDYELTWPAQGDLKMEVTLYVNGAKQGTEVVEGTKYVHHDVDTNVKYQYVLKTTDGNNFSSGAIKEYTRTGATRIENVSMAQVETANGYDALIEWPKAADAQKIQLTATNGSQTITKELDGNATSFTISDVKRGETWNVTLVAVNGTGTSRATKGSLRIGTTLIGYLADYESPEDLVANGDDDEASAWLWLHAEYPGAKFVSFKDIKSQADLEDYRVLFWLRDLEGVGEGEVFSFSNDVKAATPAIRGWYKDGGSLLLWSHAIAYIETLGRLPEGSILGNDHTIGTGAGGWNGDVWNFAVSIWPDRKFRKDFSTHPIYRGLEYWENGDGIKLIPFKGAGWTEDHNMLFFNYPSAITGLGNGEEACYNVCTQQYGIYPLGTWDSQVWWVSQLNNWEAQQGNTEFKGTIVCIGNGGCEFSLKNADGTPDKSAYPKNNQYQDNVLRLAKNSLEYLKTR